MRETQCEMRETWQCCMGFDRILLLASIKRFSPYLSVSDVCSSIADSSGMSYFI